MATLDNTGAVSASLKAIPGGTHSLTARYGGDAKFSASTSNPITVTVAPEPSTTLFVAGVGGSILQSAEAKYGEQITMAVLVQGASTIGYPTGLVTLSEGANVLGQRLLNFGEHEGSQQGASSVFGIVGFPAGVHILNASYPGDPSFNPSTSPNFQLTINKNDSFFSSVHLQGDFIPNVTVPIFGQISLASGTLSPVSGTVAFSASSAGNSLSLGSATLDPSSGTFASSITLPSAGTWILNIAYSGDANVNATLTQQQITVNNSEATALTLTSNLPNTPAGGPVTFTAQVSSAVTSLVPAGNVTFMDGSVSLGAATLDSNGIGKLTTSSLTGGSHSITANFSGGSVFRSSSAGLTETISDYLVQAVTASVSITAGHSGSASLAVVPEGGFNQTVTFACSGLPSGDNCTFAPPALTPDGANITTDTMTISTLNAAARNTAVAASLIGWAGGSGIGLVGLCLLAPMVRRKRRTGSLLFAAGVLALGMIGCGGGSTSPKNNVPPPPATFQVTVTATTTAGTVRSAIVSVTVVHQ